MDKQDWLLTAIGDKIEPIQLQKTLFKFAQESGAPSSEAYSFVPYNWGPCSFDIYGDLSNLRLRGLIESVPTGRGWNTYRLTDTGRRQVLANKSKARPDLTEHLHQAREYVVGRHFEKLLQDVYRDYPEYATESLFRR
jgi:hypothetical protein